MKITLLTQPKNEGTCGQYCVAMVAGKPVEEVIEVFGHRHGTYTKEVVKALEHFGYVCPHNRLKRITPTVPDLCMLKMICHTRSGIVKGHWVVCQKERIYNPWGDDNMLFCKNTNLFGWKFSSYLEIIKLKEK